MNSPSLAPKVFYCEYVRNFTNFCTRTHRPSWLLTKNLLPMTLGIWFFVHLGHLRNEWRTAKSMRKNSELKLVVMGAQSTSRANPINADWISLE